MGTRIPSHQLSNGLYVSGRPEPLKEPQPVSGGDVKNSGDLGKMFAGNPPPVLKPHRTSTSGSIRSDPNSCSGPIPTLKSSSGSGGLRPTGLITSGPLRSGSGHMGGLQPTGLITSGPVRSGSGPMDPPVRATGGKTVYGSSVTTLGYDDVRLGFRVSRKLMWVSVVLLVIGLMVGAFLMVAVKKPVILIAAATVLVPAMIVILWNCVWKKRGLLAYLQKHPDDELRSAVDGQFVKVTGVIY